jgi:hypothetical protein
MEQYVQREFSILNAL